MKLDLSELLMLLGRLDDAPGADTPRDRYRRYLTRQLTTVQSVRELLDQTQVALGEQHARARQDLVALLGRFLGFEVAFGTYDSAPGAVRLEGHWRSRRRARIALEVRGEQTADAGIDTLARTVTALAASLPADAGERWVGLCVTTPFYAARQRLETQVAHRAAGDIRAVSLDSLLWLAEMSEAQRVDHNDVLRLLTSGPDSDFMVQLMRRLTETALSMPEPQSTRTPRLEQASPDVAPRLSIVGKPDRASDAGFWLATLRRDETATPEQLLDAVIARRQVLGVTLAAAASSPACEGDRVCFYIDAVGIAGHAQLDSAIQDGSAVIRLADRFTAVFRLRNVTIYDVPHVVLNEASVLRQPEGVSGTIISPLTRDEFERLTAREPGGSIARSS
jgi:hypothetical protein